MWTPHRFLTNLFCAAALTVTSAAATAQSYPEKPIRFIVGFAPGGSIDAVARIMANHLTKKLGQPVTVENRTGANGVLAAVHFAQSPPDGYTVFFSNASTITVTPLLQRKQQYDVERDFAPLSLIASFPFILMLNPENERTASVSTLADFVALAKSKPGQLTYGSNGGPGNLAHLSFELLDRMAGTKMVNVPYRGAADAQLALLSKSVDVTFDNPSAMPQVTAGKLKPIAVSTPQRWRDLPGVPSISESGYPGYDTSAWVGAFVHARTPPAIAKLLSDVIRSAADDPAAKAQMLPHGELLMLDPQQFAQRIKAETATYAEIIKRAGIQLQD